MTKRNAWVSIGVLAVLAGLAYLPYILQFGYTFDDWYLMWAARAEGARVFHAIFSEDRPLRAYLLIPAYTLFGENVLWWNVSAFMFRFLGGVSLWWLLKKLWPHADRSILAISALFVLYPGFLSQFNGIDYQSQIAALTIALLSLVFTVQAIAPYESIWRRAGWWLLSGLCSLAYIGLVDYFIGFEAVRLAIVFMINRRTVGTLRNAVKPALLDYAPFAAFPVLFLLWRLIFFEGGRQATNPLRQLIVLVQDPVGTALHWVLTWLGDIMDVLLRAWYLPLVQALAVLDVQAVVLGLILAGLAAAIAWFALSRSKDGDHGWQLEALWLGLFSLAVCLLPVILANREVTFPYFSRYALASALGVAMVLVALIEWLPQRQWRGVLIALLVFAATLTHFANSARAAHDSAAIKDFWWQVAWRAPMLERGTTIVAQYPDFPLQEDYFVWGPANLIYSPAGMNDRYIEPAIFAALPTEETAANVLNDEPQQYDRRKNIVTYANYRNILLMLKPTPDSCVRIVGDQYVDLSSQDEQMFREMAPFSEMDQILASSPPPVVPEVVFGPEPEHNWCYYYQTASLARQRGDWDSVIDLGQEARDQGLTPIDPIEWMPFLQGEAIAGDLEVVFALVDGISNPGVIDQFCLSLDALSALDKERADILNDTLCVGN